MKRTKTSRVFIWDAILVFVVILILFGTGSCAPPRYQTPQFEAVVTKNLVYAKVQPAKGASDGNLILDLYQPAGDDLAARPLVVLAHGGALKYGDRAMDNITGLCRDLAARGFVCASIEYRLKGFEISSEAAVYVAAEDMAAALRWIVKNQEQYRIDPKRMAIGGFSAGASATLFMAYQPMAPDIPIRAAISLWGGMSAERRSKIRAGGPPLLIIHGTKDDQASYPYAKLIEERMKTVGISCRFVTVPDANHNPPLSTVVDGKMLYQYIADFLCETMELHS